MPSEIKLSLIRARNLPVMDVKRGTTDAYCVVKFGRGQGGKKEIKAAPIRGAHEHMQPNAGSHHNEQNITFQHTTHADIQKTTIAYNSLDPEWNQIFSFRNIDDEGLQEKYFEVTVYDKDTILSDQYIGTVNIDLSPLLASWDDVKQKNLDAWYPIYNFEKGLRGDLQVQVKLTLIKDENTVKFIQSTEVEYFCNIMPPPHQVKQVLKFVEELLEFKRRDDTKVVETLNLIESRCLRLQRKLAKKVSRMGGNAVIGYKQVIDDEGSKSQRIVIRGYGMAVVLVKSSEHDTENYGSRQQ